jgi:hypothetical protein
VTASFISDLYNFLLYKVFLTAQKDKEKKRLCSWDSDHLETFNSASDSNKSIECIWVYLHINIHNWGSMESLMTNKLKTGILGYEWRFL